MVATLKLDKEGYTVSDCRDTLKSNLRKTGIVLLNSEFMCLK